jgi:ribonuclease Z
MIRRILSTSVPAWCGGRQKRSTETGYAKASPEWQRMRRAYHTSSRQLGDLATRARPELLILYHQSYQFAESTEEDLLREMQSYYDGRVVSGHDLDVY